jgi:hypothetical protein
MKTECTWRIAFLNPRVLIGFALYAIGLVLALAPMSSAASFRFRNSTKQRHECSALNSAAHFKPKLRAIYEARHGRD